MGLFARISKELPNEFSLFQLMDVLKIDESEISEARNLCKQFYQQNYITRISKNMYRKNKI